MSEGRSLPAKADAEIQAQTRLKRLRWIAPGVMGAMAVAVMAVGFIAPQSLPALALTLRELAPAMTLFRWSAEALLLWQMPRLLQYLNMPTDPASLWRARWRIGSFMAFYELLMAGIWLIRSLQAHAA